MYLLICSDSVVHHRAINDRDMEHSVSTCFPRAPCGPCKHERYSDTNVMCHTRNLCCWFYHISFVGLYFLDSAIQLLDSSTACIP